MDFVCICEDLWNLALGHNHSAVLSIVLLPVARVGCLWGKQLVDGAQYQGRIYGNQGLPVLVNLIGPKRRRV